MGFLKFGLIRSSLPGTTLVSTLECKTRKCILQDVHNQPIYNCAYSLLYYLRWTLIFYRSIFCALNLQNVKRDELSKDLHTEINEVIRFQTKEEMRTTHASCSSSSIEGLPCPLESTYCELKMVSDHAKRTPFGGI